MPDLTGGQMVVLRRMDSLKTAIDQRDWDNVEWHYDNVRSALEKAFGVRDRADDRLRAEMTVRIDSDEDGPIQSWLIGPAQELPRE